MSTLSADELEAARRELDGDARLEPEIVSIEEFVRVDEQGAEPLVGDADSVLIPEGGDVMFYGDGGAGKTTLSIDLACHLRAGDDWLGIPVARIRRVLIIENEGPRPLMRKKLGRKLAGWNGSPIDGRLSVLQSPWAQFTFASEHWRAEAAAIVKEHEVDVLIAGPLTRLGMDAAGTLQEIAAFMSLVNDVRGQCHPRLLTVALVHHENKGGAVSGAWEGSGDTLLHVQGAGNGHTVIFIQKARWSSDLHNKTLKLEWTDGEGFKLEGERDYLAEVTELLADGVWRVVKAIAAPKDKDGIGASEREVKNVLEGNPDLFEHRTGKDAQALGHNYNAHLWSLRSTLNAPDADSRFGALLGSAEESSASASALKTQTTTSAPPTTSPESASNPERRRTQTTHRQESE